MDDITLLPAEVQYDILKDLPYESILDMKKTAKLYNALLDDESFWKEKLEKDYQIVDGSPLYHKYQTMYNIPVGTTYRKFYETVYQKSLPYTFAEQNVKIMDAVAAKDYTRLRRYLKDNIHVPPEFFQHPEAVKYYLTLLKPNDLENYMNSLKVTDYLQVQEDLQILEREDLENLVREDSANLPIAIEVAAQTGMYDFLQDNIDEETFETVCRILGKSYDMDDIHNVNDDRILYLNSITSRTDKNVLNRLMINAIKERYPREVWKVYLRQGANDYAAALTALVKSLNMEDLSEPDEGDENTPPIKPRVTPDDIDLFESLLGREIDISDLNDFQQRVYDYYLDEGKFPSWEIFIDEEYPDDY